MGIVYHAHYLVWFEIGRTEWCRAAGLPYAEMERAGIFIPVTRVECAFRRRSSYDDPDPRADAHDVARRAAAARSRTRSSIRRASCWRRARRITSSRTSRGARPGRAAEVVAALRRLPQDDVRAHP